MISSTILLIHPPADNPLHPCWDAAVVAGILSDAGFYPIHYDGNLDFCRTYLSFKKNDGLDLNKFTGEEFFDPAYLMGCKQKLNTCLTLAAQGQSPSGAKLWTREVKEVGKDTPTRLLGEPGLEQILEKGLERKFDLDDPGAVIFLISSPDQTVAAQAMVHFIKSRYPGVGVLGLTRKNPDLFNLHGVDHLVWNKGPKDLVRLKRLLGKQAGVKMDTQQISPDFSGMEMGHYLTPGRVLRVYPMFFKNPVRLSDFLEDLVGSLGVQGFVFAKEATDACSLSDMSRHLAHWLSIKQPQIYFSLQVGTEDPIPGDQNNLSDLFLSGLRLIHWEGEAKSGICEKTLWRASKIGIWNHLTYPDLFRVQGGNDPNTKLKAKFIVNNPNIVHSFKDTGQASLKSLSPQNLDQESVWRGRVQGVMDYAKVQPLPGVPFWTFLDTPAWLLVYLSQFSRKYLACLRADMANESIICLGSQMDFVYQSPRELGPGILDEICKMVEAGGSVDLTHVRYNLERAYLIGYAVENGVIIGNSSLKHPRKAFIERLKQMTGVDFTHFVERGYTSVRPEYRSLGVGAKLLEGLTKRAKGHKVFSIISEENLATQKIAIRNNTQKILTYFSEKLNKQMGVWMPEEMIDTSVVEQRGNDERE